MKTKKTQIIIASICAFLVLSIFALSLIAIFAAKSLELKGEVDVSYSTKLPASCTTLIFDYASNYPSDIESDSTYTKTQISGGTLASGGIILFYNSADKTAIVLKDGEIAPTTCRGMFANFKNLKEIYFNNFNTSSVENMSYMFLNCEGLTKIKFGSLDDNVINFNTSNVKTMESMFDSCSSLQSLIFTSTFDTPIFDTSNVQDMSEMFRNCEGLTTIKSAGEVDNVIKFNTSNVRTMDSMFSGCKNLESLDIRNFSATNLTDIGDLVRSCEKLTNLKVFSSLDGKLEYLFYTFSYCKALTELDLSNWNVTNVKHTAYLFNGCENLKTIYVKEDWVMSNVTLEGGEFSGCENLEGGKGTTYDASRTSLTYAKIDGGPSNPGYFTKPPATT